MSIYQTFDFGFDPTIPEPEAPPPAPSPVGTPPPSALVNGDWLPPVGLQMMPNCFVWSSIYGLVSSWAAVNNQWSPTRASLQASPDYAYIQFEQDNNIASDTCQGGNINKVLEWLIARQGTASLQEAPNYGSCTENWFQYGSDPIVNDNNYFGITGYSGFKLSDGLPSLQAVLAGVTELGPPGMPVAYGTYLYKDFLGYGGLRTEGPQVPVVPEQYYVTTTPGEWLMKSTDQYVGHCMMIIGYDDNYPGPSGQPAGAVLIQNSFGTAWGMSGYIWMGYAGFFAMAAGPGAPEPPQGNAYYLHPTTGS